MEYNFKKEISKLSFYFKGSEEYKEIYSIYLKIYSKKENIKDEFFYKKFLSKYHTKDVVFKQPLEAYEYDWDLILKLVISNNVFDYSINYENIGVPELVLIMQNNYTITPRPIHSFFSLQLHNLIKILLHDWLRLSILYDTDAKTEITDYQIKRLQKWNNYLKNKLAIKYN